MAIKITKQTATGIVVNDAYCKVSSVMLDGKSTIRFSVDCFAGEAEKVQAFETNGYCCKYDISGNNPIAQAYMYLKTLPEFEKSKDC